MSVASRALLGLGEGLTKLGGALWSPFVGALAAPLQREEDLGPTPGQSVTLSTPTALYDVERTPYPAWLGQLGGVVVPRGASTEQARDLVRSQRASRRGTPAAIVAAAQSALTGTRRVLLVERDGSPWRLRLVTYRVQTPDPAAVVRAVSAEKPVGIVFVHEVRQGVLWGELGSLNITWRQARERGLSWDDLGLMLPPEQ